MPSKKIKVFLGAFVNQTNAQNLSCRALAKYLDKERFEVYTLSISHGNLEPLGLEGIKIFNCFFPVKISGVLGFIWGFFNADVVYLPRGVFLEWQIFLLKVFKVKSFKTVRNVIDDDALKSALSQLIKPTKGDLKKGYNFVNRVYSMTSFMADYNHKRWGINCEKLSLLPPSEIETFKYKARIREELREVIFIGNDWPRKGLIDFLNLANEFPNVTFHIVGKGNYQVYKEMSPNNTRYHGLLAGSELIDIIVQSDIHILPSRSEGLPRVLIETMANGLPSILYSGYGAEEFVRNGSNGFVLNDLSETLGVLQQIISGQISLKKLSQTCFESSVQFDPRKLTQNYEQVIEDLYAS